MLLGCMTKLLVKSQKIKRYDMGIFTVYKDKLILLGVGIVITLVLGLGFMLKLQSNKIEELSQTIQSLSAELVVANANKATLEAAIKSQNVVIESNRNDYEAKVTEYEEWQAKPAEIKYKTIVKEIKSDDCIDIKNALDELSTIKF